MFRAEASTDRDAKDVFFFGFLCGRATQLPFVLLAIGSKLAAFGSVQPKRQAGSPAWVRQRERVYGVCVRRRAGVRCGMTVGGQSRSRDSVHSGDPVYGTLHRVRGAVSAGAVSTPRPAEQESWARKLDFDSRARSLERMQSQRDAGAKRKCATSKGGRL